MEDRDENMTEWQCQYCTLFNSDTAISCEACEALRPEAAQQLAEAPDLNENVPYEELMELSHDPLVLNIETFECPICLTMIQEGEGVTLKECLHNFCRDCLVQTITHSTDVEVKCPFLNEEYSCESLILQCEVKSLVPEAVFQQYLARGVTLAEAQMRNSIHCKTLNCPGWVILEEGTREFNCPVCNHGNCVSCQAVHDGLDCQTYQLSLNPNSAVHASLEIIKDMIAVGSAMSCPMCGVTVVKTNGCAALICSLCKTELCWMTKGPRWGPGGRGDTSGGCRCNVDGRKCHPACNNCH